MLLINKYWLGFEDNTPGQALVIDVENVSGVQEIPQPSPLELLDDSIMCSPPQRTASTTDASLDDILGLIE